MRRMLFAVAAGFAVGCSGGGSGGTTGTGGYPPCSSGCATPMNECDPASGRCVPTGCSQTGCAVAGFFSTMSKEVLLLGLLKKKPMYGYEIKQLVDEELTHFAPVSSGSLYHNLKTLEKKGLVSKTVVLTFLVSFGLVKALANLFAGRMSDRIGRKQILVAGWLAGQVMKGGGYGVLVDIILGVLGGVVGGMPAAADAIGKPRISIS